MAIRLSRSTKLRVGALRHRGQSHEASGPSPPLTNVEETATATATVTAVLPNSSSSPGHGCSTDAVHQQKQREIAMKYVLEQLAECACQMVQQRRSVMLSQNAFMTFLEQVEATYGMHDAHNTQSVGEAAYQNQDDDLAVDQLA